MELAEFVNQLRQDHPGLAVDLSQRSNTVTIHKIAVDNPGQGTGTDIMGKICAWSDQYGYTLALSPTSEWGTPKAVLRRWYKQFGFTDNTGSKRDYNINESMVRTSLRPELSNLGASHHEPSTPLIDKVRSLSAQLIQAAQAVLDEWAPEADGWDQEYGHGGACDDIAQAMSDVIVSSLDDIEIGSGGWEGDDHAYLLINDGTDTVHLDIPPGVYETGGGMNWRKREGIRLTEGDLVIESVIGHEIS
jgi:hypothetical protein